MEAVSGIRRRIVSSGPKVSVIAKKVRDFDLYSKVHDDYKVKTKHGAFISVVMVITMICMALGELHAYLSTEIVDHVIVDSMFHEKLNITIDVSFPKLFCSDLTVIFWDKSGNLMYDVDGVFQLAQINQISQPTPPCESCLAAEKQGQCCNTCQSLREAYREANLAAEEPGIMRTSPQCQREVGCRVHGTVSVKKISGKLQISVGKAPTSDQDAQFVETALDPVFDVSHEIGTVMFGEYVPGTESALTGTSVTVQDNKIYMYNYFIKLVPTLFSHANGDEVYTHQYAVTDVSKEVQSMPDGRLNGLPGVFFVYELNPFMVHKVEKTIPFSHFLCSVVAVLGGVFSVAQLVNRFLCSVLPKTKRRSSSLFSVK